MRSSLGPKVLTEDGYRNITIIFSLELELCLMHVPQQELWRIVEAEHVIVILHVVLVQESVQLFQLNTRAAGEDKGRLNTLSQLYGLP